ncbi:MAG: colicin E5-related ribonuclease [Gemmataceae bacterium]
MGPRGWTPSTVQQTVAQPFTTRQAVNRATGNRATAFFNQDGSYVIVDDVTHDLVQISNRNDPNWIPDPSITNPYQP